MWTIRLPTKLSGSSIFSVSSDSGMQAWFHLHVYTSMTRNRAGKEAYARARAVCVCVYSVRVCVCTECAACVLEFWEISLPLTHMHTLRNPEGTRALGLLPKPHSTHYILTNTTHRRTLQHEYGFERVRHRARPLSILHCSEDMFGHRMQYVK